MMIPSGYTQLEYIESTGTQYIDTGFIPNQDTKVVMDAQYVSLLTGEAGQSLFGARTSSASKTYGFYYHTEAKTYRMFYGDGYSVLKADTPGDRITIVMDKNTLYFGDSLSVTRSYGEFACSYTMYLFAVNEKDSMKTPSASRLYSCQIYDNGTLVRDYVPCKNSSGVAGLYDLVNGVFYTNAGTGSFAVGYITIDFSTLQGLTIPEGVVTQIADASGRVLWSAAPSVCTVTLTTSCASNAKSKNVTATFYADVTPMPNIPSYVVNPYKVESDGDDYTLTVPAGTLVTFDVTGNGSITINGVGVNLAAGGEYDYVIKRDVTIRMQAKYDYSKDTYGIITITET